MNAFILLCLAFLAFLSPVSAVGLGPNAIAAVVATVITIPSAAFLHTRYIKTVASFYNTVSNNFSFTNYIDWYSYTQKPLAIVETPLPVLSPRPHKRTVTKVKLPVACNIPASQQVKAEPNPGHTHHLIWAYMAVLTVLFCVTCIIIYIQRQTIQELIKAHNELTFVVHNMPHSPFSISTNKHIELSNVPLQLNNSTDNTTLDDSGDSVAETSTIVSDVPNNKGKANRANQKCRISIKKLMVAKP